MSLPIPDADLEQGQVSELRSDVGISSMSTILALLRELIILVILGPATGGQQHVEHLESRRRMGMDQGSSANWCHYHSATDSDCSDRGLLFPNPVSVGTTNVTAEDRGGLMSTTPDLSINIVY
jgi:hypothetical protein